MLHYNNNKINANNAFHMHVNNNMQCDIQKLAKTTELTFQPLFRLV